MAVLAVGVVGAAVGPTAIGGSAVLTAAVFAAASIGAAYVDQRYVYPALFGRDRPQTPNIGGIDEMTGDDGAPGHRAWGRLALCGGHVLFFENYSIEDVGGGGSKKGTSSPAYKRRIADVGIGWTRNLTTSIEAIIADQKTFWRRDPNNVVWSDYRVAVSTVTYTTTNDTLRLIPSTGDVQDPGQVFTIGNVVRVENSPTAAMNGYWRVKWVLAAGAGGGAPYGAMDLSPLQGQTPTAGSPGTSAAPIRITRVDAGIVEYLGTWTFVAGSSPSVFTRLFSKGPTASQASFFTRPLTATLTSGVVVLAENFATAGFNGRWILGSKEEFIPSLGEFGYKITLVAADGQTATSVSHTSATNVGRILIAQEEGFLEPDANQALKHYLGTETEGPDTDLLGVYGSGNVHGYRGLARSTIRNLNLTNFGDRVPQFSAAVKVSDTHTTHNVLRDLLREAFDNDDRRFDLSLLESNALLGYTRRGRQETTTTLQPLAIAYGIEAQERGDRWTFFKGKDAPVVQLAASDFGAYVGRTTRPPGPFAHQRAQDADLPRSLSLFYRDPLNDFSRTEKSVTTALPEDGQSEAVAVDLDPLVLYPWDAQNVVNRLFDEAVTARDQGKIVVPPSRCDLLPNDRVTFTALNSNSEDATIAAGEIAHTLAMVGIEPFSVSIEVDLDELGRFRIVDDGDGNLVNWPEEAGTVTATIDYETGEIAAACADDDIVSARVTYEFPCPWRMRVQRVTRRVNGTTELDLVAVADKFPVVGSPVQTNEPAIAPVIRPAQLRWEVLDIPAPTILFEHYSEPGYFAVAAAQPGSDWRGAVVYASADGINYEAQATITKQTTIGRTTTALGDGDRYVPDWENSVNVVLDYGDLESRDLDALDNDLGRNFALIGDELVAFQSATLETDGSYTLTGLMRGRRDTEGDMPLHAEGERFVLLDGLGVMGLPWEHGIFQPLPSRPTSYGDGLRDTVEIGRPIWWKVVPAGGLLDDVEPVQVTMTGRNCRPFRPQNLIQGSIADYGYDPDGRGTYDASAWLTEDIVVRWWRRTRAPVAQFGAAAAAPLIDPLERYEVKVLRNDIEIVARTTYIGGQNSGSPMVHRQFRYTLAQQTADGWTSGDAATIEVRQIGVAGLSEPATIEWEIP